LHNGRFIKLLLDQALLGLRLSPALAEPPARGLGAEEGRAAQNLVSADGTGKEIQVDKEKCVDGAGWYDYRDWNVQARPKLWIGSVSVKWSEALTGLG
jgi:hypothetical protein